MAKSVLFGGTGYIGSHVAEQLIKAGHKLTAVVRPSSNTAFLKTIGANIISIDFGDITQIEKAISGNTLVYNCLAEPKIHNSMANMRKVEIDLTSTILCAAKAAGAEKFVQLSSIQAYGFDRPASPISEEWPLKPTYAFNQICALREEAVTRLSNELGINTVIVRPVNVLGERDTQFAPIAKAHCAGIFMTIAGDHPFSAIDARDAGRAMVYVGEHANSGVYLAKGFDTSWLEIKAYFDQRHSRKALAINLPLPLANLFGAIGDLMPYRLNPAFTRFSVAVLSTSTLFDDQKIRNLGFRPDYRLEDALASY